MISNYVEYRITKTQEEKFRLAIQEQKSQVKPDEISPVMWQAQLDAAESIHAELVGLIAEYEVTHKDLADRHEDHQISMAVRDGLVVMGFPQRLQFLALPPEEAIRFGQFLIDTAKKVPKGRPQ